MEFYKRTKVMRKLILPKFLCPKFKTELVRLGGENDGGYVIPQLSLEKTEGFCNLGSSLIYNNDSTQFSRIHLQAMESEPDPIYGGGFRSMKSRLDKLGWNKFLKKLNPFTGSTPPSA